MSAAPKRPRKRTLFAPIVILLIVLVGWTGWWFWLVQRIEREIDTRAEAWRGQGWTVEWHDRRVSGWPFRARFEAAHVSLVAPSGQGLSAPALAAEANAYDPTHWVAVAEEGLVLTRGEGKGKVAISGGPVRVSVSGLSRPVPTLAIEFAQPVFTAHEGAEPFPLAGAERVEFHLRPHGSGEADPLDARRLDVFFRLEGARGRPEGPIDHMTRDGRMDLLTEAVIDNAPALNGRDIPSALAAWSEAGGRFLEVRGQVRAGESEALLTSPALALDDQGRLVGTVTLDARRVTPALAGLARSDQVNTAGAIGAAGAAAGSAATGGTVDLVVRFRDGRAYVGPFPLAPAPKLF